MNEIELASWIRREARLSHLWPTDVPRMTIIMTPDSMAQRDADIASDALSRMTGRDVSVLLGRVTIVREGS